MNRTVKIFLVLAVIFFGLSVFLLFKYFGTQANLVKVTSEKQLNSQILDFERFFVEKVINAQSEVSFNDRLQLEEDVKNINDKEISDSWSQFVNSATQAQAEDSVKKLLLLLIQKIKPAG